MRKSAIAASLGLALFVSSSVSANILMAGDYISTQISNDGTLGEGGSDPGLVYDETGTGTFDPQFDYIAPGTPFEGFGVQYTNGSTTSGVLGNRNSVSSGSVGGSDSFAFTSLTDLSAGSVFDNFVRWTGGNGVINIVHDYFFDNDEERINITTTITALTDLTDILFARAVDPDPGSRSGGGASTNNQRGIDANTDGDFDDAGDVAPENFVGSIGPVAGKPLGLFADSNFVQNTGIVFACCSVINPNTYLAGGEIGNASTGDDGIGIGFNLGNLTSGSSVSVDYAYVMGGSLATIDIPDDPTDVPAPASLGLLGLGLLAMMRRRFSFKRG